MKKIIYILIAIVVVVALAGIFKFDILSNFSGYDVDGNKIENQKKNQTTEVKDFDSCVKAGGEVDPEYPNECLYQGDMVFTKENQNPDVKTFKACQEKGGEVEEIDDDQRCSLDGLTYFFKSDDAFQESFNPKAFDKNDKELVERLKKIKVVIEKNDEEKEESIFPGYLNLTGEWPAKKWKYSDNFNNKNWNTAPIKPLLIDDREYFAFEIIGKDKKPTRESVLKRFPGLKKEDFENTGDLKYKVDFDILLNNYLIRSGYEPQNSEHLEGIIKELKK